MRESYTYILTVFFKVCAFREEENMIYFPVLKRPGPCPLVVTQLPCHIKWFQNGSEFDPALFHQTGVSQFPFKKSLCQSSER